MTNCGFYLLEQKSKSGYDEAEGFVIQADCAKKARQIASKNAGDEGAEFWLNAQKSTCKKIDSRKTPRLILRAYNAG